MIWTLLLLTSFLTVTMGLVLPTEIYPIEARMSSVGKGLTGDHCIDGDKKSMCQSGGHESYPWVCLRIPRSTVRRIKITGVNGHTINNMKVWVGTSFPTTASAEYSEGALFGTYQGKKTNGKTIVNLNPTDGLEGSYVVIQMADTDFINLTEIEVFGLPTPLTDISTTGTTTTETATWTTTTIVGSGPSIAAPIRGHKTSAGSFGNVGGFRYWSYKSYHG